MRNLFVAFIVLGSMPALASPGPVIQGAPPTISSVISPSGQFPTDGGVTLRITGNFLDIPTVSVTVGGSDCPILSTSNAEILCTLPAGQGTAQTVVVNTGGGSDSATLDYDPPAVIGLIAPSFPTDGGVTLTLGGSNFGSSATVTVAGAVCPVQVQDSGTIDCTLPPGQGAGQIVEVAVSGQTAQSTLDYDPPRLDSFSGPSYPTTGGNTLTLNGANFGSLATATVAGASCFVLTQSSQQIQCIFPEGEGTAQLVQVAVSGQLSNALMLDYDPPIVNSVTPGGGSIQGGRDLTVMGFNFSSDGATVTVGGLPCTNVVHDPTALHFRVTCTHPAGTGRDLPVQVTAGGQSGELASAFSYLQAALSVTVSNDRSNLVPGQSVAYELVATNAGPDDAEDVQVTSTSGSDLENLGWTCVTSNPDISCGTGGSGELSDIANLSAGTSVTWVLDGTVADPAADATLSVMATLGTDPDAEDPTLNDNQAEDVDTLVPDGIFIDGFETGVMARWLGEG